MYIYIYICLIIYTAPRKQENNGSSLACRISKINLLNFGILQSWFSNFLEHFWLKNG